MPHGKSLELKKLRPHPTYVHVHEGSNRAARRSAGRRDRQEATKERSKFQVLRRWIIERKVRTEVRRQLAERKAKRTKGEN